jgi:integrase/recombinase XerD
MFGSKLARINISVQGAINMTQAKVLTQQEVEHVLCYLGKKPHAARNQAMFLLTHGCGVRIKELVSLRICDVLDRNGDIHQEVHLNRNQTKGDRGRTVYLSQKMREVVHAYLRERFGLEQLLAVTLTDTTRALFATQKNPDRGFSPSTGCQMFHYWYKHCNIMHGSSHSGRRSFITNLANKGVSIHVLKELAGHRSIAVTEKYIARNPAVLHASVNML